MKHRTLFALTVAAALAACAPWQGGDLVFGQADAGDTDPGDDAPPGDPGTEPADDGADPDADAADPSDATADDPGESQTDANETDAAHHDAAAHDAGVDANDAGADANDAGVDAADSAPPPPTWSAIYAAYFATSTVGHCGKSGCHSSTAGGFKCGSSKSTCYTGLVNAKLITPASPATSPLIDPSATPLAWFGGSGDMPEDEAVTNADAAAAVKAWVLAGAANN